MRGSLDLLLLTRLVTSACTVGHSQFNAKTVIRCQRLTQYTRSMDDKLRLTLPIALEYPTTPYDTHEMIPNKVTGVKLDYIPMPS